MRPASNFGASPGSQGDRGYLYFLFDFVTRMRQALREIPVVRQDKQAFGLGVEPADIKEAGELRRQEIEDRIAGIGIRAGGNEAGRFVQDDVELAFAAHQLAADFDVIALGGLGAEVGADAAVNRDAAGGDQLVAIPPRTDTGGGEETVQAHGGDVEGLKS